MMRDITSKDIICPPNILGVLNPDLYILEFVKIKTVTVELQTIIPALEYPKRAR